MESNQFGEEKGFHAHLDDLKSSLKYGIVVFVISFILIFAFSDTIITLMQQDLAVSLHGLSPFEVLNVRLGISAFLGLIATFPIIAYIILGFMSPGLTDKELKVLKTMMPISYLLFVAGSVFSYQLIFKNAINFFIQYTESSGVAVVWGLRNTLMLGFRMSLLTGILFQIPLIVTVLERAGLVTIEQLREYRPYFVVAVLIIASVATPPDIVTQILITVPIILLYQLTIEINLRI